jgi:hypothetical protein
MAVRWFRGRFWASNFLMIILLLFLIGCESSKDKGALSSDSFVLSVKDSYLSVKIVKAPLGKVLEELGRKVNLKIYMDDFIAREAVSVEFKNLPLEEGIKRILQGRNYMLTYADTLSSNGGVSPQVVGIKVVQDGSRLAMTQGDSGSRTAIFVGGKKNARPLDEVIKEISEAPDASSRIIALKELYDWGGEPKALPVIVAALRDDDPNVRKVALDLIEDADNPPVEPIAKVALNDPSPQLRINALEILVDTYEGVAGSYLKKASNDSDPNVRKVAQKLLKELQEDDH